MSSSRYPQPGDGRYLPPRDRSPPPPRYERRPSTQYDGSLPARSTDASSYRPGDSYTAAPRAPKSQDATPRAAYSTRGRGGGGSGSRSDRDVRDVAYSRRRDKDDWNGGGGGGGDGDSWNSRHLSPVNTARARSRSPPTRDFRDKDAMSNRDRDRARDAPLSASSIGSEGAGGYFARGGGSYRGRGRGDYDARSRGRGSAPEERDSYKARSRSRDRSRRDRDRDYRDERPRDRDRPFDDGDRYRRDAPMRPDSRNSGGSQTNPSTPLTANPAMASDRWRDPGKPTTPSAETSRRQSFASTHEGRSDFRASLSGRVDNLPAAAPAQSPTSPPLPTFATPFGASQGKYAAPPVPAAHQPPRDDAGASRSRPQDPILNAPKAPKAELQIPKGPRAAAPYPIRPVPGPATPGHRHEAHHDGANLQSPSLQRFSQTRPPGGPAFATISQPTNFGQWSSPTFSSRQSTGNATSPTSSHDGSSITLGAHPGMPGKHVPTGPRAQQQQQPQPSIRASMHRPTEPAAMAARRMSNQPKGPSIMKPLIPTKRDSIGDERPHPDRRTSFGQTDKEPRRASASILGNREHVADADDDSKMDDEADSAGADGDSIGQADDSDEDDLSEEDYEEAERAYRKDIENLEAKRPPSPSHHPEIVLLLEELNALEAAAQDLKNGIAPPPLEDEEALPKRPPLGLPSPSSDDVDASKQEDQAMAMLDQASVSEELPVDGLPYLTSRPLTPVSDIDCFDANDPQEAKRAQFVLAAMALEREQEEREWEAIRETFPDEYRRFRLMQDDLDEQKRREEDLKKAVSPQPPGAEEQVKEAPPTTGRRRDRSAFSTQADENAAIQASKESYEKEQKEREERELMEAASKEELPDLTREAVIPAMYSKADQRADIFQDTNHLVDTDLVLQMFNFTPPLDDFTQEEQDKFIDAYVATPKKWGHIARELPGRNYQDCILHYYLTKKDHQYKLIAERRKARRGRGRKVAAGKPKASALLSDIHRSEGAPGQDELTDAGRPKRAAAPVSFGEPKKGAGETASGKSTPGRKPPNAKGLDGADSSSDKPTTGRGSRGGRGGARKDGGRGRGGKSTVSATASGNTSNTEGAPPKSTATSAPLLAPGPSPQKGATESPRRSKSIERRVEEAKPPEVTVMHLEDPSVARPPIQPEPWREAAPIVSEARPGTGQRPVEGNAAPERQSAPAARTSGQGRGPMSSYWSVSEVELFNKLIEFYGTDWTAIASQLTSKSQTMVKNYYQRQIEKGKHPKLEQIASEANKRNRERGGPPADPPVVPSTQQPSMRPRRPEPTQPLAPQPTTQRPLAPSSEMTVAEAEAERLAAERVTIERAPAQASPYGSRANLVPLRQAGAPVPALAAVEAASHGRPTSQEAPRAQPTYYPLEQRERRPDEARTLDQDRFATMMSTQHAQVHDLAHGMPKQRDTVDPYAARQPLAQQPLQPGRTPQMPLAELDRGQRPGPYQPKQETYPIKAEHYPKPEVYPPKPEHTPPGLRRETSYGNERYRPTAQPAQLSPHPPPPRAYGETSRPSSVIQATSVPPPPEARPNPPPEKKRSNIMMMLNDDPPEPPKPQPPTAPPEARAPSTVSHRASPASSTPMYQPPTQPAAYSRRDPVESARHHEAPRHPYAEATYGSQTPHAHQPGLAPPPADRREPSSWSSHARGYAYEQPPRYAAPSEAARHNYPPAPPAEQSRYPPVPPPAAASPQPSYLSASRGPPPPSRMESPPPSHRSHSRASSYATQQPGQSLAPHPYANMPPISSAPRDPAPPTSYAHHAPAHQGHPTHQAHQSHQSHIPPPPYSQPQHQHQHPHQVPPHQPHPHAHQHPPPASSLPGPPPPPSGPGQPPRPASTYIDPMRRDEEMRRYGSPRAQYGAYPPPPPPPTSAAHAAQEQAQAYDRRENPYERRDGYDRRYQDRR